MKNKQLAYSSPRRFYYLSLILLCALSVTTGCKKSKESNPCEGLINEGTPSYAALIFIDDQTGKNLLLSENIDTAGITITPQTMGIPAEKGMIINQPGAPLHGSLVFHIADTKKGTFRYKITIPNVGTAILSYINEEVKSGNECKPYYINVTDPVIEDHQFTLTRTGSRLLFLITL